MRTFFKVLLFIPLFAASVSLFYFQPPTTTRTLTVPELGEPAGSEITTTEERSGISKLMDILGVGFLALSVWLWRKELGITGVGPFTGDSLVEQQKPSQAKSPIVAHDSTGNTPRSVSSGVPQAKLIRMKQSILDLLDNKHLVSASSIAAELGVSRQTSEEILYQLLEEGKLRADGFPRATVFTKTDSIENRALDLITSEISQTDTIKQERRFVRIAHRFEVDSYVRCQNSDYIIEIKSPRKAPSREILATWISGLLQISKELSSNNLHVILAIVLLEMSDKEVQPLRRLIRSVSLDSRSIDIQIRMLSAHDFKTIT